jgi:hypothetical protein
MHTGIYNLLSAACNRFYNILFPNVLAYRSSAEASEEVSDGSEVILYSTSSHAPKSINLHRSEQKGKDSASPDSLLPDTLTAFLQIGHLYFITEY